MDRGGSLLTSDDVLPGVAERIDLLQVEPMLEAGQKLDAGDVVAKVVADVVGAGLGVGREATVLIAWRGHAGGLLSASVRLGQLGTVRAQVSPRDLTPELDTQAARHRDRGARLFIT